MPEDGWREFRPRPERLPVVERLRRLVWNSRWNETRFLVSCAERLIQAPTDHSQDEIFARLAADLGAEAGLVAGEPWLSFRLVFVSREGEDLQREVLFQSAPRRLAAGPVP